MRKESRTNPLQPMPNMKKITRAENRAAEKRKIERGFSERLELTKKRRGDLLAPPQEPRAPSDPDLLNVIVNSDAKHPYIRLTGLALSAAPGFTVDSVRALQTGSASTNKLLVWLEVVARGLVVRELAGTKTRRFNAAHEEVKVAVHFSTQFQIN